MKFIENISMHVIVIYISITYIKIYITCKNIQLYVLHNEKVL